MINKQKEVKKTEFDFNSYKEFRDYIDECDYNTELILNKKAKITKKEYHHFLEVMFPAEWINKEYGEESSFILNECLTEDVYFKFSQLKNVYWCECVRFKSWY